MAIIRATGVCVAETPIGGLLKVTVANEPSSVPEIIDQLMPLPKGEQQDLARLLKRTSMSKLIEANTALTNLRYSTVRAV